MSVALTPEQKKARFELVSSLVTEGLSIAKIARKLGYGEQYLRDWMRDHRYYGVRTREKVAKTQRSCLCCDKVFDSEGIHNRLCIYCKTQSRSPLAPGGWGDTGRQVGRAK